MTQGSSAAPAAHARIFREAQRSADTIFSHYQLSQLLATHALPDSMAEAVLDELVHVCGAAGGQVWLVREPGGRAELVAGSGGIDGPATPDDGPSGWVRVELEDVGTVLLAPLPDRAIDTGARRFLSLVRHELAMALRGALLRETLERERAELVAVIHGASDAIVLVDPDRRVTRLNPAAERMLGRSATTVIGARCDLVLGCVPSGSPARPCGGRCPFERVLRAGEPIDGDERTVPSSTGEAVSVVGSYAITSRAADGRRRAVGIFRDVTELARLAELRRGFLGTVSHELRTPLALIKGYVETILHLDPDPATAHAFLRRIDEATARLGEMVAQILDATALADDRLELARSPVDLAALVRAAIDELTVRIPQLEVGLTAGSDLPVVVGDADRLRQVLDNVLGNAAKYGATGDGIAVGVRAAAGMVVIRVEDDGIGIPDDERDLVFEQFHRARNARQRGLPGSGLGLAISRRLVEAHGGTIAVESGRDGGTAVEIRLPAREAAPAPPTLVALQVDP